MNDTETSITGQEPGFYSESKFARNDDGSYERSVIWKDNDTLHTETTVINKTVPSAGVIILTALVFTLIGALIAGLIFFSRFIGVRSIVDALKDSKPAEATPAPDNAVVLPTPSLPDSSDPGNAGPSYFSGSLSELYSRNVGGVVIVQSYNGKAGRSADLIGTGTGFCISGQGYILTNEHVVADANSFQVVTFADQTIDARLIGSDVRTDIAVLKIDDASLLTPLEPADSSSVRTGDFVFAIGHPTGDELSFTATFGMVGAVDRSVLIDGVRNDYIQIDAAINPGNSGGPLFDMNGKVIGVNSAKTVIASYDENGEPITAEGLGFALPINLALQTASTIINEGGIQRPGIGISTITVDEETAEQYQIPQGALVYTITENSPGHLGGLKIDDIITGADDVTISASEDLGAYVRTKSVGETIVLHVWRDGEALDVEIVVGNLNELGSTILNNEYGGSKYGFR
ncbi:MAG: trypsin-like peptidase domain-containing protein [Clostridia bacterium]|nr:trypsin-like peptidase domain-containing protein [Clostridia bacterium]